ncbi:MAG: hypothetical protein K0S12_151 [Bacteroidetes bacterium]|jgi:hypothetical protein|nr:hypothetical protein [Bacteroidota bacterium]
MRSLLNIFIIVISLLCFVGTAEAQSDEMFKQKRERKRLWRRWKPNREAYNPYLKQKGKKKVSARMAKGDRKELKRQKRAARKQMRKSKRKVNS